MKFEHVLKIYWTKGLLFNNTLEPFSTPVENLFKNTNMFGKAARNTLVERFEMSETVINRQFTLRDESPNTLNSINTFFSQFSSVNSRLRELQRLVLIRLFLIKTFRGRAHALGKPSRGQRTWSNAWTSYNLNKTTRAFINDFQRTLDKEKSPVKRNYKLIQKRVKKSTKSFKLVNKSTNINSWF